MMQISPWAKANDAAEIYLSEYLCTISTKVLSRYLEIGSNEVENDQHNIRAQETIGLEIDGRVFSLFWFILPSLFVLLSSLG